MSRVYVDILVREQRLHHIEVPLRHGVEAGGRAGLRRSGPLVALLVLPLFVPIVIFGAEELSHVFTGQPFGAGLTLLCANGLAALAVAPFAMAAAMKLE